MVEVLPVDDESLIQADKVLRAGGVIVYPTDSVYGIAAHALNLDAVTRVRDIKVRDKDKPFQIEVSPGFAERYAYLENPARHVIRRFWPGALSIVVKKKATVPDFVSRESVCLSCQANRVSRRISALLSKPFITTSANLSGTEPPKTLAEVSDKILSAVDLVLDDGPTKFGVPNTILDLTGDSATIVRDGPVKRREIERVVEVE